MALRTGNRILHYRGCLDPTMGEIPGSPPPELAKLILVNDGYYFDASAAGVLVQNTAPPFVDLDMEAVNCAAYGSASATLSKETTSPHSGARNLRVTKTSAPSTSWSYATQIQMLQGNRYLLGGYLRGDGVNLPGVATAYNSVWGTASTLWQAVSLETAIPGGGDRTLYWRNAYAAPIGAYAEFDDWAAANLSVNRWNASVLGPSWTGLYLAQAAATRMPWAATTLVNGLQAIGSDATDEWGGSLAAAAYTRLHASHATWWNVIWASNVAAVTTILTRTCSGGAATTGVFTSVTPTGAVNAVLANGSGVLMANLSTAAGVVGTVRPHVVVVRHWAGQTLDVWVDGAKWSSALTGVEAAGAPTEPLFVDGVSGTYGVRGYDLSHGAVLAPLMDHQVHFLGRSLAAKWGGVWS